MHFTSLLTGARAIGFGALGSVTMGCSVAATPDAPDADVTSTAATAVVVVERTTGPGDAVRGDAVIARFVRVRQGTVDDQALRTAGAAWDLPAVGSCSSAPAAHAASDPPVAPQPRAIDLLDVGALALDDRDAPTSGSSPRSTELLRRTMFDPTGGVSGVFYSARSTDAFSPSSSLRLHTSGGPDLPDGFVVDVASPREIGDVRVAFRGPTVSALDVFWDAADEDARDLVYVDVLSTSGRGGPRLVTRCTTLDVGHLVVTGPLVGTLDEGQLAVHRLHRESFRSKGIERGEIRFDVARVVNFHR